MNRWRYWPGFRKGCPGTTRRWGRPKLSAGKEQKVGASYIDRLFNCFLHAFPLFPYVVKSGFLLGFKDDPVKGGLCPFLTHITNLSILVNRMASGLITLVTEKFMEKV
jgi:hypothetical protein